MRITTKNTLIGGGFVLAAAFITVVAMFLTKGPTHNADVRGTDNVTFTGQSGGITAERVTINVNSGEPTVPTLVKGSVNIEKEPDRCTAHIDFQSSSKTPLGQVEFVAKVLGNTGARILSFSPGVGVSFNSRQRLSADGSQASLSFSRTDAANPVILRVSAPCKVAISGSHDLKTFTLDIK